MVRLYVFSADAEEKLGRKYIDGQCNPNKAQMPVIAIAQEILNGHDPDYAMFVFLHEVVHIAEDQGHTKDFYDTLDCLIDIFNSKTGMKLVNDYR